jgi:hypothetical protein
MENFGHGPWHVAMIQDPKGTTTKIVTHTHVSLLLDAMHEVSKHKEKWIPLLEVGPFSHLEHARTFAREWTEGARGIDSRLTFGEQLYKKFQQSVEHDICLAIQCISVETYTKNRQWDNSLHIPKPNPFLSLVPTVKQIQVIENDRKK